MPAGEEEWEGEGEENGVGWVLCLEFLSLSVAGGNLRRGLRRGGFQQNIFSRCALSGWWAPPMAQCRGRGSLVAAAGASVAHLVLLLFWAWS